MDTSVNKHWATPDDLPRVALFFEFTGELGRSLLRGVVRYVREHRPWNLYVEYGDATDLGLLASWRGDGLIARARSKAMSIALDALPLTKVLITTFDGGDERSKNSRPTVHMPLFDWQAEARVAFEHLRQRGYHHFAFCPFPGGQDFGRLGPFNQVVSEAGFTCFTKSFSGARSNRLLSAEHLRELAEWLVSLPKPVGLWAANDLRGQHVIEACKLARLRVPDDVAVLGTGNDELLCELCAPPLSSVAMPFELLGYEAAATLAALMAGKSPPSKAKPLLPSGVVTRQSTDIIASTDADVVAALRFIRQNAARPISVEHVLQMVSVSRSTLRRRFMAALGHGPGEEIERVHVERAKELLIHTDLKMIDIASRSGFANATRLSETFRRSTGMSPGQFRHRHGIRRGSQ